MLRSVALAVVFSTLLFVPVELAVSPTAPEPSTQPDAGVLARLPLAFEENRGQTDDRVDFLARGAGYTLYLADGAAWIRASGEAPVRMRLLGAAPGLRLEGREELPGRVSYFIGDDPTRWRTDVPTYRRLVAEEVYPGVDLVYHGSRGELEYDLVVAVHHEGLENGFEN